ncbi:MAG TPA: SRPBCC domain-containing protein [Bacteroidia bacterium]|nr:SRPBCC domain-containing protein [Bacteroidia bacterium]HNP97848.1 SRPBCC domain-containing protein [Bacteroidia bacterium]
MKKNFTTKLSIRLHAAPAYVWEALTNPLLIEKYLFATDVHTDWREGNSISLSGEYEGKIFNDQGVLQKVEERKLLKYTYFRSLIGKVKEIQDYVTLTYKLSRKNNVTVLTLVQEDHKSLRAKQQNSQNWKMALRRLKAVLEEN